MIKTIKKVIALLVMMFLGELLFAQASNLSIATFGRFQNDADWFFSSSDWKNVDFFGLFVYDRLGANITAGIMDIGTSFKAGELYIGAYYNGNVLGYKDGASTTSSITLYDPDPSKSTTETISVSIRNKKNVDAVYGALVGFGSLGFKLTFEDKLEITGSDSGAGVYNEIMKGSLTPALEIGGSFGPLYKISLRVPIVYDSGVTTTTDFNEAAYETKTLGTGLPAALSDRDRLLQADGNYVQIDLGLAFLFGGVFYLDNNLRVNIYGVNAAQKDGKSAIQTGVADIFSGFDPFTQTNNKSSYLAIYDNRFWIQDEIVPSFDLVKDESEKFAYAVNLGAPIKVTFVNHAMNAKGEANAEFSALAENSFEVKDYYKQTNFDLGVSPFLKAAVQWKPAEIISLQCGIGLDLFSLSMKFQTTEKVNPFVSGSKSEAGYNMMNSLSGGAYDGYSNDSSVTMFDFTYPNLNFALGFTLYIKEIATLDFAYINKYNSSLAGLVYKAVGEGLGNGDTSLILTVKF
jgi:hypothetical protein